MSRRFVAFFLLGLLNIYAGCIPNSSHASFMNQMRYDYAQLNNEMEILQLDLNENKQNIQNTQTKFESILNQQSSLLEALANDDLIPAEGFQLYKDFILYVQESSDPDKTYEFIQKMRTVLPEDKMERITDLHFQLKQNESEYNSLQKQKATLKERLMLLNQQEERLSRRGDRYLLTQ